MRRNSSERWHTKANEEQSVECEDTIEYAIKLLLSCQIAWSISSRNEPKVAWMLDKFGSDVRLSKNDEFYPATAERVCLINGTFKQMKSTLEWICNVKMEDKNDEIRQMKILVPKTSMGNLMYRGNSGLKAICERENVELQIPEHNNNNSANNILREICITIGGKKENIIKTSMSIAKIIKKDLSNFIFKNVSYEDFNGYIKWKELQNNIAKHFNKPRMLLQPQTTPTNNPWAHQTAVQQQQQTFQQNYPYNQQNQYFQQQYCQPMQQASINPLLLQQTQTPSQILQHQLLQQQQQQQQQQIFQQQQQQPPPPPPQQQQQQQSDNLTATGENQQTENNSNTPITQTNGNNEEKTPNQQIGNPIPSLSSFWRMASDEWRTNNNNQREQNNNQNDTIPGFN